MTNELGGSATDQDWCSRNGGWCTTLGIGGATIGTALNALALRDSLHWIAIPGLLIMVAGLMLAGSRLRGLPRAWRVAGIIVGLALAGSGVWVVANAFDHGSSVDAGIGVAIAAGGLLLVSSTLVVFGEAQPEWCVGIGATLAALGVGAAAVLNVPWGVPIGVTLGGLMLLRVGIEPFCASPNRTAVWCTSVGLAAASVGLILILIGAHRESLVLAGVGLFLLVLGWIPASVAWLIRDVRPLGPFWAIVVALIVGLVGYYFWPKESPTWLAPAATIILLVFGVSFSVKGEGYVAVAAIALALMWVLVDTTDPAPLDPFPVASDRILALGDSYSSGEGSTFFFEGTNVRGANENGCRRSSTAYPYLVASDLKMGLSFFACSGAIAAQVHRPDQGQMPRSPSTVAGALPQLENITDTSNLKAVLISIGGNDAEFGKIGLACVLPGSCDAFRQHWLVRVAHVGAEITAAFEAIRETVEDSVPIVAIPYPLLLTETGCGWSALTPSEHDFLSEFITVLDDRVRKSAEEAGIHFFQPGLFSFEGARICDGEGPDDADMNFFNLHPTEGGFLDRINPANWFHGTFHPNRAGHEDIARDLEEYLEPILEAVENGADANPEPDPGAEFTIHRINLLEPVLLDPSTLPTTSSMKCRFDKIGAFATVLPVDDATDTFQLNASAHARVCSTLPDGTWTDSEEGVVFRPGGDVSIQPQLPERDYRQYFVYKETGTREWRLRIVEFCNLKEGCPYNVDKWINDQLAAAAKRYVMPAILVAVGSWMLGIGGRSGWSASRRWRARSRVRDDRDRG